METATVETATGSGLVQFLSFKLEEEKYGVDVRNVRNILEHTAVTKLPRTPESMLGVINDRGGVLPVVDLRLKFGLPKGEKTIDTCIIVLEATYESETVFIGVLVDSVEEVIDLEIENIDPPPKIGTGFNVDFIQGMGKQGDQFITLLNIEKVFSNNERTPLEEAGHTTASGPALATADDPGRPGSTI